MERLFLLPLTHVLSGDPPIRKAFAGFGGLWASCAPFCTGFELFRLVLNRACVITF
ncbi:hypothetical protein [Roseibium sediminicola]|uniref:Uncharacterized protein n=1 Tax=Roseibium sediminicola TaxID=2933272 RepID=A0ABT0GZJ7_9HYPH|nr:hypothetical protein [Roseibium sp. CAU 1639]MCK7614625.1 hypothetical protein [Roseibium sp. CAU 1639]